jgi:hypothetical protein
VSVRDGGDQAMTARGTAIAPCHVGLHPSRECREYCVRAIRG